MLVVETTAKTRLNPERKLSPVLKWRRYVGVKHDFTRVMIMICNAQACLRIGIPAAHAASRRSPSVA